MTHNSWKSSSIPLIRCWKCSGVLVILKGSLLKQNCPWGVMNVVKSLDSLANGTCQNLVCVHIAKHFGTIQLSQSNINLWHWVHFSHDPFIHGFQINTYMDCSIRFGYYYHSNTPQCWSLVILSIHCNSCFTLSWREIAHFLGWRERKVVCQIWVWWYALLWRYSIQKKELGTGRRCSVPQYWCRWLSQGLY